MTVLLVLAIFAIFIAIDYVRTHKQRVPEPGAETTQAHDKVLMMPKPPRTVVAGFELPEHLRYHLGHTWALEESPTSVRVGLDDFAARLLGKCDSIALPKRGQWIRQGQKLATLYRDGQKAELASPIEGEISSVNGELGTNASLACRDPYGNGWLVSVMSPDAKTNFRNLLSGDVARRWMAEAASRLRAKTPSLAGAVAQDGGIAVTDLSSYIPAPSWQELAHEFFLI